MTSALTRSSAYLPAAIYSNFCICCISPFPTAQLRLNTAAKGVCLNVTLNKSIVTEDLCGICIAAAGSPRDCCSGGAGRIPVSAPPSSVRRVRRPAASAACRLTGQCCVTAPRPEVEYLIWPHLARPTGVCVCA